MERAYPSGYALFPSIDCLDVIQRGGDIRIEVDERQADGSGELVAVVVG